MTTPERRQVLYTRVLQFMRRYGANSVPFDIHTVCDRAKIELVPLSQIIKDINTSPDDIFSIWGNDDGAVLSHGSIKKIAYNDFKPAGRVRFTLCEEVAHIVCGHIEDPDFNVFAQKYAPGKYAQYDEEARLGAGFLVCHPRFFYTYERHLQPEHLSALCGISISCAKARREVYMKYKGEITSNITYQFSSIPQSKRGVRRVVGL